MSIAAGDRACWLVLDLDLAGTRPLFFCCDDDWLAGGLIFLRRWWDLGWLGWVNAVLPLALGLNWSCLVWGVGEILGVYVVVLIFVSVSTTAGAS